MRVRDIADYIADHYDDFPNFDGRTVAEVLAELPDHDPRYADDVAGLIELLNAIKYLSLRRALRASWLCP